LFARPIAVFCCLLASIGAYWSVFPAQVMS
jgi:hypothetical protein